METLLDYLNGNPWLNLAFLILAILSIGISLYLYFASQKEKKPRYNIRHFNLVRDSLKKLKNIKITYGNNELKNLTLTRFSLWNHGRDTIDESDVANKDRLRIEVPKGEEILEANIDYTHNEINNLSIEISENKSSLIINFDYLHTFEGCIITIYHTASGDDVCVLGTVKGAGRIKKGVVEKDDLVNAFTDKLIGLFGIKKDRNWLQNILLFILIILSMPIVFAITPIENILRIIKSSPSQFLLDRKA